MIPLRSLSNTTPDSTWASGRPTTGSTASRPQCTHAKSTVAASRGTSPLSRIFHVLTRIDLWYVGGCRRARASFTLDADSPFVDRLRPAPARVHVQVRGRQERANPCRRPLVTGRDQSHPPPQQPERVERFLSLILEQSDLPERHPNLPHGHRALRIEDRVRRALCGRE